MSDWTGEALAFSSVSLSGAFLYAIRRVIVFSLQLLWHSCLQEHVETRDPCGVFRHFVADIPIFSTLCPYSV
jgi:hypothetical protein